jgi:AcrR family transcriptional regulator
MSESETRGRRRDPDIERRIIRAAIDEYARTGWAGFSMEGVARKAGVGKAALYLRWSTKEQLLLDSLDAQSSPLTEDVDTGSLEGDVIAVATELLQYFLDPAGWTSLRISIDARAFGPQLGNLNARIAEPIAAMSDTIFQRGIARAEVPDTVCIRTATETLFGGVLMHVLALAPDEHPAALARPREHVLPIVKLLLAGVGAQVSATP